MVSLQVQQEAGDGFRAIVDDVEPCLSDVAQLEIAQFIEAHLDLRGRGGSEHADGVFGSKEFEAVEPALRRRIVKAIDEIDFEVRQRPRYGGRR